MNFFHIFFERDARWVVTRRLAFSNLLFVNGIRFVRHAFHK